nr:hypothetical protein [Haloglomus halophilum]
MVEVEVVPTLLTNGQMLCRRKHGGTFPIPSDSDTPRNISSVVLGVSNGVGEFAIIIEGKEFPPDLPDCRWSRVSFRGESCLGELDVALLALFVSVIEARGGDARGLSAVRDAADGGCGDELASTSFQAWVGVDSAGEPREEVPWEWRWRSELELSIQEFVRVFDGSVIDNGDAGYFFDVARETFETAGGEDAGARNGFDGAPLEQVSFPRFAIDARCTVVDRFGELESADEASDFSEASTERAVVSGTGLRAVVPLSESIEAASGPGGELVAVAVTVMAYFGR